MQYAGVMPPAAPPRINPVAIVLAFGAIYFIWGSTFLATRYLVSDLPPLLAMGMRSTLAGLILVAYGRSQRIVWPSRRELRNVAALGFLFFVGCNGVLGDVQSRIESGLAALFMATIPLWVPLFAWIAAPTQPPGWRVTGGTIAGFVGVALLFYTRNGLPVGGIHLIDALLLLLSAMCWAVGTVAAPHLHLPASPLMSAGMQLLIGGTALCVVGVARGEFDAVTAAAFTPRALLSLGYIVLFGLVMTFSCYMWLLKVVPPSRVTTYAFVNPMVAVLLGWAVAGETLNAGTLAAMAIVVVAVAVTVTAPRPQTRKT
jgi:drug/metabolite transporter (DMT)-like permease